MDNQNNELIELRSQIAAQARQLILDGAGEPETRLQMLMELIRSGESTIDIYRSAYEITQQLSNDDDKINSMLSLLYEIDKNIAMNNSDTDSES